MPALTRRQSAERRHQKITLGEMRASGVRGLLIYCADYRCSHSTAISGDEWPDDVRLSDLEARFICRACGTQRADIRPDFDWDKSGPTSDGVSDRAQSRNESADSGLISGGSFVEWERAFDQPVPLPNGPPAQTLRDAANYTKRLLDSDRDRPECRLAIRMLIDAAEDSVRKSASSD